MKRGLAALVLGGLMLLGSASTTAQVRIGFGVHIGVPPPPGGFVDLAVGPAPYPGAVWVRGCWTWNRYERRNVWIPGHWIARRYGPAYHERYYRHVPHGVARGWWRKHGGEWRGREWRRG